MSASKFYAVRKGKKTGIFMTWNECKECVIGYCGAEYKSFKNYDEAIKYLNLSNEVERPSKQELNEISNIDALNFIMEKR